MNFMNELDPYGTSAEVAPTLKAPAEVWTIQRVLVAATKFLNDRGSDSARLDAELLLAHALGLTRIQLYTAFDRPLSDLEREPFKEFLRRRASQEPVAYITGVKEFFSHVFHVTRDVLIPRPDTEVLVEQALLQLKNHPAEAGINILDVGTGSGCVAIALAKRLPTATVTAWDISEQALVAARENAQRLEAFNVAFAQCDALQAGAWAPAAASFHVIVANPPYIAAAERSALPPSVIRYEPEAALFAEDNGLAFYARFAASARPLLAGGGALLMEIGSTQAASVTALFAEAGWRATSVVKDYEKNDRVVIALP